MPFTTNEGRFKGAPVIEILRDGEPLGAGHPMKDHFRFGVRKARLILTFFPEIEAFGNTEGRKPRIATPITRRDLELGECECVKQSEFKAHGRTIERPYLELRSGAESLGLGLTKAEAVLHLRDDLRQFVSRHSSN